MRFALTLSARQRLAWATVVLLLISASGAHAQWTWRDRTGQVNASDRPPPRDIPDKDILSRPPADARRASAVPAAAAGSGPAASASASVAGTTAALPAAPKNALEREVEARKRVVEQEQQARVKGEEERLAAQRVENCRRARSQLAAFESGQRIARINDKGEREVLDDKARADESRQAREVVGSDCR